MVSSQKQQNMVKIVNSDGVDDEGTSKKNISQLSHLGSFTFSHSKTLMNDVTLALDGFENIKKYQTDTDSIYIHNDDYEIIKAKGLIGKDLYQSKNDSGKSGVPYGL